MPTGNAAVSIADEYGINYFEVSSSSGLSVEMAFDNIVRSSVLLAIEKTKLELSNKIKLTFITSGNDNIIRKSSCC